MPADAPVRSEATQVENRGRLGLIYGITAYTMWGLFPLYFRAVSHVPSLLVLCHRIFWSALFLAALVTVRREWRPLAGLFRDRRKLALLFAGAVLIALNWLLFIYAIASRQLLQASLGYFINPLLSIALGMLFYREKLRPWQWGAVLIATASVANLALRGEGFPWIAVSLAGSFGFYGLVRKKIDVNSLHSLLIETCLLLPVALTLVALAPAGHLAPSTVGMLSISGVITPVALLFFSGAVRRLKLSTIGFLQYLGPSLQFLVAVILFGEALDSTKLASFILCWAAIALYVADSLLWRQPPAVADEPD